MASGAIAVPFITTSESGTDEFVVHDEAINLLQQLEKPVAVVSVAGVYRSGKSYLLNLLTGHAQTNCFQVGGTTKACTKGIWLWKADTTVDGSEMSVIFLDTEGLGSTDRSETYDVRIFALAVLLSSYFIYNSVGTIDNDSISQLSLVVHLTKYIQIRAQSDLDGVGDVADVFPAFMWVVRDFTVRLERSGKRISAREYLDSALQPNPTTDTEMESINELKAAIRKFFPHRDCMTLVRPVHEEEQLRKLSEQPYESLREEFQAQITALKKKLNNGLRPKSVFGQALSGQMLAQLATAYVDAINSNQTPTVSTAWERVVESQCSQAVEAGFQLYEREVHAAFEQAMKQSGSEHDAYDSDDSTKERQDICGALDINDLHTIHSECREKGLNEFDAKAVKNADTLPQYRHELLRRLDDAFSRLQQRNEKASSTFCSMIANEVYRDSESQLKLRLIETCQSASSGDTQVDDEVSSDSAVESSEQRDPLSTLSAAQVHIAYCAIAAAAAKTYTDRARGPAKDAILANLFATRMPQLMSVWMKQVETNHREAVRAVTTQLRETRNKLSGMTTSYEQLQRQFDIERKQWKQSAQHQEQLAQTTRVQLEAAVSSKQGEIERLTAQNRSLLDSMSQQTETLKDMKAHLETAQLKLQSSVDQAISASVDSVQLQRELTDAHKLISSLQKELRESGGKLAEVQQEAAVYRERYEAAEAEAESFQEQKQLLQESIVVQKDLFAAKNAEKEECEYQWGAVKAKLAQSESDRLAMETEVGTLESIIVALKRRLRELRQDRSVVLPPIQQRRFNELPVQ